MAVGKDKVRRITTIPKKLDKLIVEDANQKGISISERIAIILKEHYASVAGYTPPEKSDS